MQCKAVIAYILLLILHNNGVSQQVVNPPFFKDVQALKLKDSLSYPAPGSILFTGSSSFTRWQDIETSFPGYYIVNRAFGGSTISDLIRYANEVITPYRPKQVVIYCGDNDLATPDSTSPEEVASRFEKLFFILRTALPKASILYVSIKPSPSREGLMPKMERTNKLIKAFLRKNRKARFADVYSKMLLPNGKPDPELFVEDNLHMNAKGYAIWQKVLKPYLLQ